jgi:hypothetical protein
MYSSIVRGRKRSAKGADMVKSRQQTAEPAPQLQRYAFFGMQTTIPTYSFFGFAQDTLAWQNASSLAFALAYSYLCKSLRT